MDPALFVRWCYATVLLREPESADKQAEWEAKFKTDGPDLTYAAFLDSAEGQARQGQRRRLLDEAQGRIDAERAAAHP